MACAWQRKLGDSGVQLIERELTYLYDPDIQAPYEIKTQAIQYVRRRISEMLGRKKPIGLHAAAWFFQQSIYDGKQVLALSQGGRVVLERLQGLRAFAKRWDW